MSKKPRHHRCEESIVESNPYGNQMDTELSTVIKNYNRIRDQWPQNPNWLRAFYNLMRSEWTRLRSFYVRPDAKWPFDYVTPEDLANAGFFFLSGEQVQCAFCLGIVSNWERGDRPFEKHNRHFPRCPFIMGENVSNIPMRCDQIRQSRSQLAVRDNNISPDQMKKLYGIQVHFGPKHSYYKTIQSRKDSYIASFWKILVSIDSLAEAGFFATRTSDHVRCFHCDGSLFDWEPSDDPWIEHAKWFPECHFVQLNKSQAFINQCKRTSIGHKPTDTGVDSDLNLRWQLIRLQGNTMTQSNDSLSGQYTNSLNYSDNRLSIGRDICGNKSPFGSFGLDLRDLSIDMRFGYHIDSGSRPSKLLNKTRINSIESGKEKTDVNIKPVVSKTENYQSQLLCKICFDQELGVVFLPCGHQACPQCTSCLTDCHICRTNIRAVVRTYFV